MASTAYCDSGFSANLAENKKGSTGSSSLKRKRPPVIEIPNVLREILVDKEFSSRESGPLKDAVCFSDSGFAVFSLKGKKKFMEDAHKIASCPHSNKKFFGVYDGHGGSKAAEFVVENLHANIFGMLQNSSGDLHKEEAIKAGFLKTDQDFLKLGLSSGACCVTALIEDKEIVVSNLGDCRAILCRGGLAEVLTTDHKAGHEDERRRIEDKGGFVQHHRGAWRVHGVLSVSRSIGDSHLKDWVLAEPDTKIIHLTQDTEFLVLASDGLWEEVGNEEAAEIVRRTCLGEEKVQSSDMKSKENIDEHGTISTSPSPKLQRVNTDKHGTIITSPSPKLRRVLINPKRPGHVTGSKKTVESWRTNEDIFGSENDSPPSKVQRTSATNQTKMKNTYSNQENSPIGRKPTCGALIAACKELTNLAVTRGSLDDITVMIIDLNFFKN